MYAWQCNSFQTVCPSSEVLEVSDVSEDVVLPVSALAVHDLSLLLDEFAHQWPLEALGQQIDVLVDFGLGLLPDKHGRQGLCQHGNLSIF